MTNAINKERETHRDALHFSSLHLATDSNPTLQPPRPPNVRNKPRSANTVSRSQCESGNLYLVQSVRLVLDICSSGNLELRLCDGGVGATVSRNAAQCI